MRRVHTGRLIAMRYGCFATWFFFSQTDYWVRLYVLSEALSGHEVSETRFIDKLLNAQNILAVRIGLFN